MPKCLKCNDRGGFFDPWGRWRKCTCRSRNARMEKHTHQMMLDTETPETELRRKRNALQSSYARGEIDREALEKALQNL